MVAKSLAKQPGLGVHIQLATKSCKITSGQGEFSSSKVLKQGQDYTLFDETTEVSVTSKSNVYSYSVDLSGNDVAIVLNIASSPAQNIAMLIRIGSGWW